MSEQTLEATGGQLVDWGDTSFTPEERPQYGDRIRIFRMGHNWPNKPFEDRQFQLGGKERVAFLEETVYVSYQHRFNQNYMGSGVNGTRKCTKESLGHCLACDHYEAAPTELKEGRKVKKARCGPRQQQFGCNILVYKTDLEGRLLDAQNQRLVLHPELGIVVADANGNPTQTPGDLAYEVFLWRFSSDKFTNIRQIKQDWGNLTDADLVFVLAPGKEENFQDFTAQRLPSSGWKAYAIQEATKPKAVAVVEYFKEHRYAVEDILGKNYSDDDMQMFLGFKERDGGAQQTAEAPAIEHVASEIEAALSGALPPGAAAPAPPPPAASGAMGVDELLNAVGSGSPPPAPTSPPPPAAAPPAQEAPPAPVPAPPAPPTGANFDDLLKAS